MGVDNSGIILIGERNNGESNPCLAFFSDEQRREAETYGESINDYLYCDTGAHAPSLSFDNWTLGSPSGYESSGLVGFYIKSPSYSSTQIESPVFLADIVAICQAWKLRTGRQPKVFVLNLQW